MRSQPSALSDEPLDEVPIFQRFCEALTLENGRPVVLEEFERRMVADYFGGTIETLILIPKKNGKSTLLSLLALYHLHTTPDAECVIAAASRDQAAIMLGQARGFIRRSPGLQARMRVKMREIVSMRDDGRIRVLASDVDTADGVIPTLALVDELHRHRSADLYGVFRDGLGPREGRMLTISTAGDDEDSPLGKMRTAAYALETVTSDGAYTYARSRDGSYVMHEWALGADADRKNLELVKTANPASWQTLEALRRRHDSPSMTPWQWARFACGVWLQGEDTVIGPVQWSACGTDDVLRPRAGTFVRIGVDLGFVQDTTALVPHWIEDGIAYAGVPVVLVPPRDGTSLRKSKIVQALKDLSAEYGARTVVIDPETGGEILAQDFEELGFEVIAHSQKPSAMALAADRLFAAIREGKLRHPKDPTLTRHALNAHAKQTDDGRWRFVKETKASKKCIDALIALAMVHSVASAPVVWREPMVAVRGRR